MTPISFSLIVMLMCIQLLNGLLYCFVLIPTWNKDLFWYDHIPVVIWGYRNFAMTKFLANGAFMNILSCKFSMYLF